MENATLQFNKLKQSKAIIVSRCWWLKNENFLWSSNLFLFFCNQLKKLEFLNTQSNENTSSDFTMFWPLSRKVDKIVHPSHYRIHTEIDKTILHISHSFLVFSNLLFLFDCFALCLVLWIRIDRFFIDWIRWSRLMKADERHLPSPSSPLPPPTPSLHLTTLQKRKKKKFHIQNNRFGLHCYHTVLPSMLVKKKKKKYENRSRNPFFLVPRIFETWNRHVYTFIFGSIVSLVASFLFLLGSSFDFNSLIFSFFFISYHCVHKAHPNTK